MTIQSERRDCEVRTSDGSVMEIDDVPCNQAWVLYSRVSTGSWQVDIVTPEPHHTASHARALRKRYASQSLLLSAGPDALPFDQMPVWLAELVGEHFPEDTDDVGLLLKQSGQVAAVGTLKGLAQSLEQACVTSRMPESLVPGVLAAVEITEKLAAVYERDTPFLS